MAEDLKFVKGMFKDTGPIDQPDYTYRDALNAVIDQNKAAIFNEVGNSFVSSIVADYNGELIPVSVVGAIPLEDDNIVVFACRQKVKITNSVTFVDVSAILLIDTGNKKTKTLYITTNEDPFTGVDSKYGHLDFNVSYPITGEYRVSANGDILVYFTDNRYVINTDPATGIEYIEKYNPPRVFNITRQLEKITSGPSTFLYTSPSKHVEVLNIFMDSGSIPEFESIEIKFGGGVESGTYHLGLAYADRDFTETNVLTVSNPVYVVPNDDTTIPREIITGSPNETQTGKTINWNIDVNSVNYDYEYLVPYIIQRIGTAVFANKLEAIKLYPGAKLKVSYSGIENAAQSALAEVAIDKVKFIAANAITQLDNRLYLANLTARKDIGYQRFANNIKLDAVTETVSKFDPRHYDIYNLNIGYAQLVYPDNPGSSSIPDITVNKGRMSTYIQTVIKPIQQNTHRGYRDPDFLFKKKGYRRGEVYAFYISFVLKDGSETFAYHIPGRAARVLNPNAPAVIPRISETDSLTTYSAYSALSLIQSFNGLEVTASNPDAKVYQYLDTSTQLGLTTGFWRNQNEFYPTDEVDFEIWKVDNNGNGVNTLTSLEGLNVRHHKMPSNHNSNFSYVQTNVDFSTPGLTVQGTNSVDFKEDIRILGIKLSDISIPKFILKQVQGYKIYYAKRNQYDKTIIGQSGAHPATPYLTANIGTTKEDAKYGPYYSLWQMDGYHHSTGLLNNDALWTQASYLSQPVFKFHDFNLLRKKHTLATATHIDIQFIATMHAWNGGFKGVRPKPIADAVIEGVDSMFYTSFRTGHGDSDYIWIHPDLGNTINRDLTEGDVSYDVQGPRILWGTVFVAARYNHPGQAGVDIGNPYSLSIAVGRGQKFEANQANLLSTMQTIFMIAPNSASYLNGLSILSNQAATAYQGATYLANTSGESSIAIGLVSGLPTLFGYNSGSVENSQFQQLWNVLNFIEVSKVPIDPEAASYQEDIESLPQWMQTFWGYTPYGYIYNNIIYPPEDPENTITGRLSTGREYLTAFNNDYGKANVYLVNLCSAKTNVFEPFDTQTLVWTGFYQNLRDVDVETGWGTNSNNKSVNYYTGADSPNIFGGDTYIVRHSYRITSQNSQLVYFKIGENAEYPDNTNSQGQFIRGNTPFNMLEGYTGNDKVLWVTGDYTQRVDTVASGDNSDDNWSTGDHNVFATIFQFMVEADDNINYRHSGDVEKGVPVSSSVFFDRHVASEVLFRSPLRDLTKMDNILYEDVYSAVQDIRVTTPYGKGITTVFNFPNRIIRSSVLDGNFNDTYRYFLALDYKDFAVNKGEIKNIFNLNALLHIHTERSLYRTKGKQVVQLSDASQAYIGSGDLFAQEPDEFLQSFDGHIGLNGKMAALVTKAGYVFVARKSKRIFLVAGEIKDLTEIGITTWARNNIPFDIENYGYVFESDTSVASDAPTDKFGFVAGYDPLFKRIIITKHELVPSSKFKALYFNSQAKFEKNVPMVVNDDGKWVTTSLQDNDYFDIGGWTISYSTDSQVWVSRHSYVSPLLPFTSSAMYSFKPITINYIGVGVGASTQLVPGGIYSHNNVDNPGNFYGSTYNFEVDCVFTGEVKKSIQGATSMKNENRLYSAVSFVSNTISKTFAQDPEALIFDPGFTSYYVYNTHQNSGVTTFKYLENLRKVEGHWTFNNFRDMSSVFYTSGLVNGQVDVQGNPYNGSYTPVSAPMFSAEGVVNPGYINSSKPWYEQKKFVDKYLGLRLICNNGSKNLVSLYTVSAAYRISPR
jgi:hypothetical protein